MRKKIFILIFLIVVLVVIFFLLKNKEVSSPVIENQESEISLVENYFRENIKTIATNEPVLGGSWYVVSIEVDSEKDEGVVIYEDGHIQSLASFKYQFKKETGEISIIDFLVAE